METTFIEQTPEQLAEQTKQDMLNQLQQALADVQDNKISALLLVGCIKGSDKAAIGMSVNQQDQRSFNTLVLGCTRASIALLSPAA